MPGESGNAPRSGDGLFENIHGLHHITKVSERQALLRRYGSVVMTTLAERLKSARVAKGPIWTQAHLAAAAGVSTGTVGMMESGKRGNKEGIPGTVPQIAKALGVSYDWLAHGIGDKDGPAATATPAGWAPIVRPQAMGTETEQRLTRFLAVLYQIPESGRAAALVAVTELLLDHLPPPPSK
jgi:transcriptional regulator with XRE-family HTH domain